MRKAILGLLFLGAVAVVVIVLRNDLPKPPPPPAVQAQPAPVVRTTVTGLAWRQVALPDGTDQVHRAAVDLERAVFPVQGPDGVHRIVTRSAAGGLTEVAKGSRPALDGTHVVSYEVSGQSTQVSTVDLKTPARAEVSLPFAAETIAVEAGSVALLEGDRCLHFLDAVSLHEKSRHCAAPEWSISFLTAENDTVQWRETKPDDACATWFLARQGQTADRGNRATRLPRGRARRTPVRWARLLAEQADWLQPAR